ncbi:hypothetical protein KP509_10G045800 [Ceratopteris richardii]|uniref:Arginine decarboxylase n=1 Tax=Ceratopteris richardii TaxID=49495 RepID=A0A8T2TYK7_CERRI|nr:hypothetical protein KP509_10G045800 [Ceratopteris richardii]
MSPLLAVSEDRFAVSKASSIRVSPSFHKKWNTAKSSSLYRIDSWGAPYFSVSAAGTMVVMPLGSDTKPGEEIDLLAVVKKVSKPKTKGGLGLQTPIILRFPEVLHDRLWRLQSSFNNAILSEGYDGCFRGVFPVKCNQDRPVVESIVEFGKPFNFGLEAGSKPELLLAMTTLCRGSAEALLVCNGYKDADYICLALLARRIGLNCVIILEQEAELDLVLSMSRKLGIEPVIGLRSKLSTKHGGHFGETSGDNGKFGLSCTEIMAIVNKLRRAGKLGCLQVLHFHMGSQIPSLPVLNDGVSEAAHIYCELALMGAAMKLLDIGGGLGIDYDGTRSSCSDMSVGYTIEEYALQVVQAVRNACDLKGVKHPTLCSESGRALISHHSVLVFDVLSCDSNKGTVTENGISLDIEGIPHDLKIVNTNLIRCARACDYKGAFECAEVLKHRCTELFKQGQLRLSQLATINETHKVMHAAMMKGKSSTHVGSMDWNPHNEGSDNTQTPNATYHINLSIFRSMPDTWAIGQVFPIVPIQRLDEEPKVRATLSDLTCDSDGKVSSFVGHEMKGKRLNHLKVHDLQAGKSYYMGMFLGGAYQEALGSLHNLFGSTCVVNVWKNGSVKHGFRVSRVNNGQSIGDVLKVMHYEPSEMINTLKLHLESSSHFDNGDGIDTTTIVIQKVIRSFSSPTYLSTYNHPPSKAHAS